MSGLEDNLLTQVKIIEKIYNYYTLVQYENSHLSPITFLMTDPFASSADNLQLSLFFAFLGFLFNSFFLVGIPVLRNLVSTPQEARQRKKRGKTTKKAKVAWGGCLHDYIITGSSHGTWEHTVIPNCSLKLLIPDIPHSRYFDSWFQDFDFEIWSQMYFLISNCTIGFHCQSWPRGF